MSDLKKDNITRDFKGIWIPREIWLRKDISTAEKALWAEIYFLHDKEKGGCCASNEFLEEFSKVKRRVLQRRISNLKSKGLIKEVAFDGRNRTLLAIIPQEDLKQNNIGGLHV